MQVNAIQTDVRTVGARGCTIAWSADGTVVDKRYDRLRVAVGVHPHRPFERERRVGRLLVRHPSPVPHARLLGVDRRRRTLRFEAVDGDQIGPKLPLTPRPGDVAEGALSRWRRRTSRGSGGRRSSSRCCT